MKEQLLTAALDRILRRCTEETGLVGGVVRVIRGGKTVYTYEYGYADRENQVPMTQDTLFDVASTSKAWTVMLAAQAIDAGLTGWDEPIRKHIPWFTMADPYAGEHLSIRDMASHRSGLPSHDFLRRKILGDRENLTRRTADMELNADFRSTYQYNNHMFILLGYVVEQLRGRLWEDQIREQIAKPLGIGPIRFRGCEEDMTGITAALPYSSDGYTASRCAYSLNAHSNPCGGIRISMKNMARWIAAMSRGGVTPDGGRLCSEEQYREIIRPVMPAFEKDFGYLRNSCYCQGWFNGDYKGHTVIYHGGVLTGFLTQVGFLPGEDCGYVMSFNTGATPAPFLARAAVIDTLLDGRPAADAEYEALLNSWCRTRDEDHAAFEKKARGRAITGEMRPDLVGVYRHPAYDTFEICDRDGRLAFLYGDFTARLALREDGSIYGYTGDCDRLKSDHIALYPQENGDIRLKTASSGGLRLLFRREK